MKTFSTGSHTQTSDGPVELGVVVSGDAMGVVVDAPFLGRLRAAFDVLGDGSARLASLTRDDISIAGAHEVTRVARLQRELEDLEAARASWEARAQAAGEELFAARSALAGAETSVRQERSALSATQQQLEEARSGRRHSETELDDVRTALQRAEARLLRTQTEFKAARDEADARRGASAVEIGDLSVKLANEQGERTAAQNELKDTRARLERAERERSEAQNELAALKPQADDAQRRLKVLETARRQQDDKLGTQSSELSDAVVRVATLEGELAATQELSSATGAELESVKAELLATRELAGAANVELETARGQLAGLSGLTAQLAIVEGELSATREAVASAHSELDTLRPEHAAAREQLTSVTAELETTRRTLTETQSTLASTQTDRASARAELVTTRTALGKAKTELDAARTRIAELEGLLGGSRAEAAAAKQGLSETQPRLRDAEAKVTALTTEVTHLKTEGERTSAELQEERARREELVRDLAYIQTQVADLASTKGERVARVGKMADREERRRRTTAEFSDVLRDAEVVAADRLVSARRQEARAGKLEEQVRGLQGALAVLQQRLKGAEAAAALVVPLTAERDALKVDISFFQKQIGALQRALAAQTPKKG